ncbi:MAG: type II toxin-antitoxin system VapC family toxin [Solirubrobacterales bacterium]
MEAIETAENRVLISAVVICELAIKRGLGKLEAPANLLKQLEQAGVELLPITARHADRIGALPPHHRDPFDRMLVAQAELESFALVTADPQLRRYGIEVVW